MATLVLEHSPLARTDRLGAVLMAHGHHLDIVQVHAGDPVPSDLDGIDAIVVCGGSHSANDADAWIAEEMDLLRSANAISMPIVGICFGNQILAKALGGTVGKVDGGIVLGWHDVSLTPAGREDPLFAGAPWTTPQLHWNSEHITQPPEGARVLAASERVPVEAWTLGLRTYGFQYHPESSPATFASWIDDDPQALAAAGVTREALDADTMKHDPVAARLAERLFERVALLLMPVDPRYAGIAKDLHH